MEIKNNEGLPYIARLLLLYKFFTGINIYIYIIIIIIMFANVCMYI